MHLRNVWPLPRDLREVLSRFRHVLVPELNRGQLSRLVRSELLIDAQSLPKVQGRPFQSSELLRRIEALCGQEVSR